MKGRGARRVGKLPGYSRIKGTRSYRTPRGKIISERQYNNRRVKRLGWSNVYQAEKFRQTPEYREWQFKMRRAGYRPSEVDIFTEWASFVRDLDLRLGDAERAVSQRRRELRTRGKNPDYDPLLRDPNGPLAQLLVGLGLRDPNDSWEVGDTNTSHR